MISSSGNMQNVFLKKKKKHAKRFSTFLWRWKIIKNTSELREIFVLLVLITSWFNRMIEIGMEFCWLYCYPKYSQADSYFFFFFLIQGGIKIY
jgi:hypothetical protein